MKSGVKVKRERDNSKKKKFSKTFIISGIFIGILIIAILGSVIYTSINLNKINEESKGWFGKLYTTSTDSDYGDECDPPCKLGEKCVKTESGYGCDDGNPCTPDPCYPLDCFQESETEYSCIGDNSGGNEDPCNPNLCEPLECKGLFPVGYSCIEDDGNPCTPDTCAPWDCLVLNEYESLCIPDEKYDGDPCTPNPCLMGKICESPGPEGLSYICKTEVIV